MPILDKTDKILWSDHEAEYRDYEYIDQIRENLNFELPRKILIYADLGLWNGRRMGYREIESGVLAKCFYSYYEPTWYIDEHNDLRCIDSHHDGTNYYLYRMYKEGISDEDKNELLTNIYHGAATEKDVIKLTEPIGPYINEIYPWTKPEEKTKHGKWIPSRDKDGIYEEVCSECGYIEKYNIDPSNDKHPNYCPNCGVPMDGE